MFRIARSTLVSGIGGARHRGRYCANRTIYSGDTEAYAEAHIEADTEAYTEAYTKVYMATFIQC